ncbi:MAG: carbohydrate-binding protein [Cytophagaceae bacterium]|nr:carbohydrate-binding protein [Cytophagaceae bacterium]
MKQNYLYRVFAALMLFSISIQGAFSQFKTVGYMPSWAGSVSAIQFTKLTHINYAFLLPTASGGFQPIENPSKLQSLVSSGHANGVKVFIAIGGWDLGAGGGNDGAFEQLAASASTRTTFVNNTINFVNQYGLDGVDIDWEYPDPGQSANNYAALMTELGNALHSRGKQLSAAVVGQGSTGGGVLSSVFNIIDHLNIMAYDANDFDHSTYNYAVSSFNYWVGRGLPKNKAILGVPFYGRPSWESFAQLVARGANPNADVFGNVGYNGITTIKNKTNFVFDQTGGGIMIWELSQDATGANSLLSAINQVVVARGGNNPPPPPPPATQTPYGGTVRNIPGKIEAEHYDNGGQGVAYNDVTPANEGAALRTDAVDIENTTDVGGGQNIGWTAAGEWLEYTVNVTTAGTYNLEFRVAAIAAGKSLHLEMNGQNVSGAVAVPNTGGWQTWASVTVNNVSLTAGQKVMKIAMDTDGFNLNYVNITSAGTPPPPNTPPTVSLTSPTNGQVFTAGNAVTINANASDANGTVSKVEFFVDGALIATDATAPYSATYTAVAGNHSITAKATDNANAATTSAAVSITVNGSGGTCTIAAWSASKVYVAGDKASLNGKVYRAKWWTQGESPANFSGQWDVWALEGNCGAKMGNFSNDLASSSQIIEIYPNPTASVTHVKLNVADAISAEVTVINSMGIEVYKGSLSDNTLEGVIDLAGLEAGLYVIRISANGNEWFEKLLKQ